MDLTVIKRDGSTEPFDPEKIARVVLVAGLEPEQATRLSELVQNWAASLNRPLVTSLEIRDEVVRQLRLINDYVAGLFVWYQKTKDKPRSNP